MNTKKNEFFIGLSMSIATLIVIVGIMFLGKSNFFVTGLPLYLIVENADGLAQGDDVYYKGLKVGTVSEAEIFNDNVLLKLKIEGTDKIPVDSKFEIKDYSLIGGKAIEIINGKSKQYIAENDTVYGTSNDGGIEGMITDFKNLEPKVYKVLNNLDSLTGNETQENIKNILKELSQTIYSTKQLLKNNLHQTLTNVNNLTSDKKEGIPALIKSLKNSSENLSHFLIKSSTAANKLDSLILEVNKGKGSAGKIVNNDSLYNNLNKAIRSVDSLVTDIKKNPKKYINISVF